MDLKVDDIYDIDPTLLLTYKLDKLNLDILPDDIPEFDDKLDSINEYLSEDIKISQTIKSEYKFASLTTVVDKVCDVAIKVEVPSRTTKRKKDINANDEPVVENDLNQLLVKLELSDSDNEQADDKDNLKLKERGPDRPRRRASRNRDLSNIWNRSENYDRSQFNSERLRFWSGSNQVQTNDATAPVQFGTHSSSTVVFNRSEPVHTFINQDLFYEDARATSVSSPESGYDSCAHSLTGSPPPVLSARSLDFIPETVDEQVILDFLIENTDGALPDNNLDTCEADEKDAKGKIEEIINYLKDNSPLKLSDSSQPADPVPPVSDSEETVVNSVKVNPAPCGSVPKSAETPKKFVLPKLDDKAKRALKEFLSKDEFYSSTQKTYIRICEDIEKEKAVKVIYVEDEMDKASENRTNLHHAVLDGKIEDIYCLVEIHKQYYKPFTDYPLQSVEIHKQYNKPFTDYPLQSLINIRDKYGKTALDYAVQNNMTLVVDYLKENMAIQSVNI